jgi:hypothetical protein
LTGQRRERSTKKETRADETSRWQIRVKKKTGDARSIATLPGAAARAPTQQDSDVRPHDDGGKGSDAPATSQNRHPKSCLCFWQTNQRHDAR